MRRSLFAAAMLAAVLAFVPGAAQAEIIYRESPRYGAIKLKLGGYDPRASIDGEVSGNPYEDTFGQSSILLFEVQYDQYLWQRFGALGLGLSGGYGEKYGAAQVVGQPDAESPVVTALHVYPLRLDALYNFDYLAQTFRIPLVPYVRGGVAYVPWRISKGGETESYGGQLARGGRWGFGLTGGIAFQMDILDRRMARDFDNEMGVNHTLLFAEYNLLNANGFGSPGLNLSSSHFSFGLAFEF